MDNFQDKFELLYEGIACKKIPVKKFKSKRTDLKIVFADIVGPLVQGFFCLSTEASSDDGLPHTLEHVIFLGSEDHPYKGILDKAATRCLSNGTNAWTDKDNTCYTITTAGLEGFLNLLPIYLDHVLHPVLSDAAYTTEVHHITGEGKDGGVVYSEMQSVENTGDNIVYMEMLRSMYPPGCGYRFETGGVLANMRESTNNEKVREFHRKFYRPENLCLIVTGKVDHQEFFEVLSRFEEKILLKRSESTFERPWMKAIAPLTSSVLKTVQFPNDDEDEGLLTIAWRGPNINDQHNMTACVVLMEFLTDTPASLLNQIFVEVDEPYCGEVDYSIIENRESVFCVGFESVTLERIHEIQPRLLSLLNDLADGTMEFDMGRMKIVIHNRIVELMSELEDDPHETLATTLIGDFLYGNGGSDLESRLGQLESFERLREADAAFWQNFLRVFVTNGHNVTVIGKPSKDAVIRNAREEETRVERRRGELGEEGLRQKGRVLADAVVENNRESPDDVLSKIEIPDVQKVFYHPIRSYSNSSYFRAIGADRSYSDLDNIPCSVQLDDIQTDFVNINLCLDIQRLPPALAAYLPLYMEVLFESPLTRDNVEISYEDVVQQLSRDTVEYSSSLGLNGSRFQPGEFSSMIVISLKVELEKFAIGVKWCGELLSAIDFTPERVSTVAKKMASDIKQMRREAENIVDAVTVSSCFAEDSVLHSSSFLAQQNFLKELQSQKQAMKHLKKLNDIREHLMTNLENVLIHMAADVDKLIASLNGTSLSQIWNENFTSLFKTELNTKPPAPRWNPKRDSSFLKEQSQLNSCIVGMGSTDSAFLIKVSPCINDFNHPDIPALLVLCHFFSILEGPMWKVIRGNGLAYSFSLTPDIHEGLLYFRIERASDPTEAYRQGFGLIQDIIDGRMKISQMELECAKCQCIYELIQSVQTPNMSSKQALSCFMRNIGLNYNKALIDKLQEVTVKDLERISSKYLSKLTDPKSSTMFVVCSHKDVMKSLSKYQTMCQCKFLVFKTVNAISL